MIRIGLLLLFLLSPIACSNIQVLLASPAVDSDAARAAVMECCRSAGLEPHEQLDFKVDAAEGGYGDRIRRDPELLEIFGSEFVEIWVYARQGRYELEVQPMSSSSSYANTTEEIERCLRENVSDAR